jgi:hypothetical protein
VQAIGYLDDALKAHVREGYAGIQRLVIGMQFLRDAFLLLCLLVLVIQSASGLRYTYSLLSLIIISASDILLSRLSTKVMSDDSFKAPLPTMADEKGLSHAHTRTDDGVGEIHDLTQLGYTPELTRNRSMLTLLFQCIAMAAVRKYMHCCRVVIQTLISLL